jgi:hypothetical protein
MDTYGHLFPDSEDLGGGTAESALGGTLLAEPGEHRWLRGFCVGRSGWPSLPSSRWA